MSNKPVLIIAAGALVVVAAIASNFVSWRNEVTDTGPATSPPTKASPPSKETASLSPKDRAAFTIVPTFDIVRVDPRGNLVAAGRAAPGSSVVVFDHGKEIGQVTANPRGEWVFVPEFLLPSGPRQLSLEMRPKEGAPVPSESTVLIVVPERDKDIAGRPAEGPVGVLALKIDKSGASTVLQKPSGSDRAQTLSVDAIDYGTVGELSISGRAPADSDVLVYLDNKLAARTRTDKDGLWDVSPHSAVKPGRYELRVDHVDAKGKVVSRIAMPFVRDEVPADLKPGTFAIIQPGNSLWRLSRRAYGQGVLYTLIFEANREQIEDPDLIYPGQLIALPIAH